jgi:cell division protein FtsI (penicillin-binding protein 3)
VSGTAVADQLDSSWRRILRRRLAVAATAFILWSIGIEARLVYLQVLQHETLLSEAESQHSRTIDAHPKRGDIVDRDGRPLALSVEADSVYAVPAHVIDPEKTIAALCKALDPCGKEDRDALLKSLTRRVRGGKLRPFVWLRRWISPEEAQRVAALDLKGISMQKEPRRYYPNRELAAHLIGYVGDEHKGLEGIEDTYERLVGGKAGRVLVQVDAIGRPFSRVETAPVAGASLELTISSYLQHIAERELRNGVLWSGASGGSVIVMDPFTGEIFALANYPTFNPNPNAFNLAKAEARRNRAVQDLYEPGSTFKIVTAGAALEEHVATPGDLINTSPGVIRFGSRVIDEAKGHNYGTLTFEDVIVKSSNVGAIKIGLKLGPERLASWVTRFGFGTRISPHDFFQRESRGVVYPASQLSNSALASVSMGYQVSITPLQMAAAVSSVANGGELIEPRVVRAVVRNDVRETVPRKVLGRTVSAGVATELTAIMEGVVERGTAKSAQIPGYTIAGKTGTAAKVVNGGYSSSDYNVSFVGFVPSRDPVFTIIVVIDSPHKVSPYGGTVAAPVFQKIAQAALRYRGVPPSLNRPPPVVIARADEVHEQPVSGPAESSVVALADTLSETPAAIPDLTGMNVRDAVRTLVRLGLSPRINGSGFVVNQRPAPGSALTLSETATLWLERRPRLDSAGESASRTSSAADVSRGTP